MVPIWQPLNLALIVLIAFTEMLMVKCCHMASAASVEIGVEVLSLPLLSAMLVGQWYRLPSPWAYRGVPRPLLELLLPSLQHIPHPLVSGVSSGPSHGACSSDGFLAFPGISPQTHPLLWLSNRIELWHFYLSIWVITFLPC